MTLLSIDFSSCSIFWIFFILRLNSLSLNKICRGGFVPTLAWTIRLSKLPKKLCRSQKSLISGNYGIRHKPMWLVNVFCVHGIFTICFDRVSGSDFYLLHSICLNCRRSPISIAAAVIYIITQLSDDKKPLKGSNLHLPSCRTIDFSYIMYAFHFGSSIIWYLKFGPQISPLQLESQKGQSETLIKICTHMSPR